MTKKQEVMNFLQSSIFQQNLKNPNASETAKKGMRYTIMRMEKCRDAAGVIAYFLSALAGTERSPDFAQRLEDEGLIRFEDIADEFLRRFNDDWLAS